MNVHILNLYKSRIWKCLPFCFLIQFHLSAIDNQYQGKDKTSEERRIAICIFDDVAEHCRETALK